MLATQNGITPEVIAKTVEAVVRQLQGQLTQISRWNDPAGLYAHCLCGEE